MPSQISVLPFVKYPLTEPLFMTATAKLSILLSGCISVGNSSSKTGFSKIFGSPVLYDSPENSLPFIMGIKEPSVLGYIFITALYLYFYVQESAMTSPVNPQHVDKLYFLKNSKQLLRMRCLQCRQFWFVLPSIDLQKTKCEKDELRECKHSKIQMNMLAHEQKYLCLSSESLAKSRLFDQIMGLPCSYRGQRKIDQERFEDGVRDFDKKFDKKRWWH